jgi:hypothetical protein
MEAMMHRQTSSRDSLRAIAGKYRDANTENPTAATKPAPIASVPNRLFLGDSNIGFLPESGMRRVPLKFSSQIHSWSRLPGGGELTKHIRAVLVDGGVLNL